MKGRKGPRHARVVIGLKLKGEVHDGEVDQLFLAVPGNGKLFSGIQLNPFRNRGKSEGSLHFGGDFDYHALGAVMDQPMFS